MLTKIYYRIFLIYKYGFHGKPIYTVRLFRNLILSKIYKLLGINKFVARGMDFATTYICNFNCSHCFAKTLMKPGGTPIMQVEDYRRVCEEAMKMGAITFSFQGGEIFYRKDWREILMACKPKENHLTITTNGSIITEKDIADLAKIGVDTVYFSLDSGIAEEHDKFRRHAGAFKKVLQKIALVEKHGMKVAINTTISSDNLYSKGFFKILELAYEKKWLLETIYARPLGNWKGQAKIMLDEDDIKFYYKIIRQNYPMTVRDLDNNYRQWGCPAVKEATYITPYGDVCPCPYSHISLGNVLKESFIAIRHRALKTKWYNHFHKECLTALDQEFMGIYLPLVSKSGIVEFKDLLKKS